MGKWSKSNWKENDKALGKLVRQGQVIRDEGSDSLWVKSSEVVEHFGIKGPLMVEWLGVNWLDLCREALPKMV